MKNTEKKVTHGRTGAAVKAGARPVVLLDNCRVLSADMNRVRQALRQEFGLALNGNEQLLRSAINEAEALAWQTPCPHLVFPVLAQEKAAAVQRWAARQRLIHRSSRRLLKAV